MTRIEDIQNRLSAATPGPWEVDELGDVATVPEFDLHRFDIMPETIARTELRKEDGAFIANAPADVSYLLAELRKAREAVADAKAEALEEAAALAASEQQHQWRRDSQRLPGAQTVAQRMGVLVNILRARAARAKATS